MYNHVNSIILIFINSDMSSSINNSTIISEQVLRRRDMRSALTFTIDPADAKDFDDGLSFEKIDNGTYQIGVHIADVTFYVKSGSEIDNEAYQKGTSTYLVDRVIPMLPEELCNDICSLNPNEDKLCMSVVFTMDDNAQVLKHKICRTVIHSNARLNYEQAQDIIDGKASEDTDKDLCEAINILNKLAKQLREARMANGSLDISQEEIRFTLDSRGYPINTYFSIQTESNHLIEEFMLLANRTVAEDVGKKPFIYRIHDEPDSVKLAEIETFLKHFNKDKDNNPIIRNIVDLLTIRAMAKAVYSTKNIGHYGLAFKYYTHFTSPIRRYPDMMVHRLVSQYILGERGVQNTIFSEQDRIAYNNNITEYLEDICVHCSEREQIAQMDERDSVKYFQTLLMETHVGEEYDATIVSVTNFGLFCSIDSNHCEGLVHINDIPESRNMIFDEKAFSLIARKSRKTYTLGDNVKVQVKRVDTDRHLIDLKLISE